MCSLIFLLVLVELLSLQTSPCDCSHTLSPVQKPVGCFQEEISAPRANIHTGVVPTLLLTAKGDATRTAPAPRPNVRMYHACPGSRLRGRGVTPCLGTGSTRLRTRDAEADREASAGTHTLWLRPLSTEERVEILAIEKGVDNVERRCYCPSPGLAGCGNDDADRGK